ncbi:MAG: WhiB family transcriptional regulator [Actinomycetota bacterium]|nr:WhiB family transcriptional regulator [Actinomycetota bacterium]
MTSQRSRRGCNGGACVGAPDPDLWFPERGQSAEPARRICARCPVRPECLHWALEKDELGVWGGLSPRERKRLRESAA